MGGAQQQLQHLQQSAPGGRLAVGVRALVPEQGLGQFQIPVAVFAPSELVDRAGVQIESIGIQRLGGAGDHPPGAGAYPAVGQARLPGRRKVLAFGIHQHEPRRVPELVAEVAVALGAGEVEAHVAARGGQGAEGEAQRIGAVGRNAVGIVPPRGLLNARRQVWLGEVAGALGHQRLQADAVDQVQGIQAVALGLGHLAALRITHQAVDVNLPERHFAGELERHHDHAGHPKEDDVVAGHQHVGRVEARQRLGAFRPAQGGEAPQRGGEPGLQHVLLLPERHVRRQACATAGVGLVLAHVDGAVRAVPGRDAMAPPLLAADAPVLDVAHPSEVGVFILLGDELNPALPHGLDGRLRQRGNAHEPLIGEPGFDDCLRAVAPRRHEAVRLHLFKQAQGVQVGDDALPRRKAVQAPVGGRGAVVDGRLGGKHVDHRQAVPQPHFVVVEVVGGGDLDAAGAKGRIHGLVGDDRQLPAHQGQARPLADQGAETLVLRMHRHRGVAEHGLRAGGCHHQVVLAVGDAGAAAQRVAKVPKAALLLHVDHLQVGDGGAQSRIPVHQPLAAVDEALLMQPDEDLGDGPGKSGVQREAFPRPVEGGAHAPQLLGNVAAGLPLPLPHPLGETVAAELVAGLAFGVQLPLHQHLGGDARMVGAHLPKGRAAPHPLMADQRIHQGMLEGMSHVQAAGDVGWRNDDAVASPRGLRRKVARRLPFLVDGRLDGVGIEARLHSNPPS